MQLQHQQVETLRLFRFGGQRGGEPGDLVRQFRPCLVREGHPGFGTGVFLHETPLGPDDEVLDVHRGDLIAQARGGRVAHLGLGLRHVVDRRRLPDADRAARREQCAIERGDQLHPPLEEAFAERFGLRAFAGLGVLAEEFEILAVVEDREAVFILAGSKEIGAEPRPAPDHLPEFRLGADELEEDQIDDLRHVDPGVEHIDRDREVRRFVFL